MAISGSFTQPCPSCEAKVPIKDSSFIGKKVDCPKCKYRFVVAAPAGAKKPDAEADTENKKEPAAKSKTSSKDKAAGKKPAPSEGEAAEAAAGQGSADEPAADKGKKKKGKPRNNKLILGVGLAAVGVVVLTIAALALSGVFSPAKPNPSKPQPIAAGPKKNDPDPVDPKKIEPGNKKPIEKVKVPDEIVLVAGSPAGAENTNFLPPTSEAIYHCCFKDFLASPLGKAALKAPGAVTEGEFKKKLGFSVLAVDDILTAESYTGPWTFHVVHTILHQKDIAPLKAAMDLKEWDKAPGKHKVYIVNPQSAAWIVALAKLPMFVPSHVLFAQSVGATPGPLLLHLRDDQTLIFAHEKPMLDYLKANGKIQPDKANVSASKRPPLPGAPKPLWHDGYLTIPPPLREQLMRVEAKTGTERILFSAATNLRSPLKLTKELDGPGKGVFRIRPMWDVVYLLNERTDRLEYVGASLAMKDLTTYIFHNSLTCGTDRETKALHQDLFTKVGPEVVQFFGKVLGHKIELVDDKAATTAPPAEAKASRITVGGHDKIADFTVDLVLGEALERFKDLVQLLAVSLKGEADMASGQDFRFQLAAAGKTLGEKGLAESKVPAETFPQGVFPIPSSVPRSAREPGGRVSWMAGLLPYLGHEALHGQIHFSKSWRDGDNWMAARTLVPQFLDPTFPVYSRYVDYPGMPLECAATHYVGISGIGPDTAEARATDPAMAGKLGIFGYDRMTSLKTISEKGRGLANTVLMIRVPYDGPAGPTPWIAGGGSTIRSVPEKNSLRPFLSTNAKGEGGTFVLMCDDSVRYLKKGMSDEAFKAICTVDGQAPANWDWDEDSLVKPPVIKAAPPPKGQLSPSVVEAQTALLKLAKGDLKKQLEKHLKGVDLKAVTDYLTTGKALDSLKNTKPRLEEKTGVTFVGDWRLVLDELRFYAAVPRGQVVFQVHGKFELRGKAWEASIEKVSTEKKG